MPSLIGPELQCLSSFLLSPGDFGHYFLQEAPYAFYMGFSDPWDMQDLLQSSQDLDSTYYQSTPLNQNNFGPQKSNLHPLLFLKYVTHLFSKIIFGCIDQKLISRLKNKYKHESKKSKIFNAKKKHLKKQRMIIRDSFGCEGVDL